MRVILLTVALMFGFATIADARPHRVQPKQECFLFFCGTGAPSSAINLHSGSHIGMSGRQLGMKHRKWCSEYLRYYFRGAHDHVVDDRAISWLKAGTRSQYGCINCVAVMPHHVGIVQGYDEKGNIILYSGNHGGRVGVGTYHRSRFVGFRSV